MLESYCRKPQPQPILKFDKLVQLKALFDAKKWEIVEGTEISFFDRYVKTLSSLQEPQQDFIIELSKRFLHIPLSDYLQNLIEPVRRLRELYPGKELIFSACLRREDIGKIKSSAAVLYQFKGTTMKSRVNLGKHMVVGKLSPTTIGRINLENSQIVLVDDFIGTGETARDAVAYVQSLLPQLSNNGICILSIVTLQSGQAFLESQGIKVFSAQVCRKGISDYYSGSQLVEAKATMEEIEKTLFNLFPVFYFGYKQSEALVCMERCPNNTFPIYWYTKGVAPYER